MDMLEHAHSRPKCAGDEALLYPNNAPDSGFFSPSGGDCHFDFATSNNNQTVETVTTVVSAAAKTATAAMDSVLNGTVISLDISRGLLYRRRRRSLSQPALSHHRRQQHRMCNDGRCKSRSAESVFQGSLNVNAIEATSGAARDDALTIEQQPDAAAAAAATAAAGLGQQVLMPNGDAINWRLLDNDSQLSELAARLQFVADQLDAEYEWSRARLSPLVMFNVCTQTLLAITLLFGSYLFAAAKWT